VRVLRVFKALSNPTRLEILRELGKKPLPFARLMRRVGMDPGTESGAFNHHLRVLVEAGLVARSVDPPYYYLTELGSRVLGLVLALESAVSTYGGEGEGGEG